MLLFYTAVRVSELVHIEVGDVDLDACKIFINRGKGAKDRYVLFPATFRLVLKSHLHAAPRNRYLFETQRFGAFTTRRIQQIVQGYREKAGITQPLHPHLFRHQMLTYLTSKGLSDAQIRLISGHLWNAFHNCSAATQTPTPTEFTGLRNEAMKSLCFFGTPIFETPPSRNNAKVSVGSCGGS